MTDRPSPEQFASYRATLRKNVKAITGCLRRGVIFTTSWSTESLCRLRHDHSASIARQNALRSTP